MSQIYFCSHCYCLLLTITQCSSLVYSLCSFGTIVMPFNFQPTIFSAKMKYNRLCKYCRSCYLYFSMFSLSYYMNLIKLIKYGKYRNDDETSRSKSTSSIDNDCVEAATGGVLKNFIIFRVKHLCWSLFLIKLQACKFIKKRLQHWCFPL